MERMNRNGNNNRKDKSPLYIIGAILGIAVVVFVITYVVYSNKLNNEAKGNYDIEKIAGILDDTGDTSSASTSMGKTVNELENSNKISNEITNNISNKVENKSSNTITNSVNSNTTNTVSKANSNTVNETKEKTNNKTEKNETKDTKKEEKKQLEFSMPVEGEIVKQFANENLLYSETLKEWVTHNGVDIKAAKTTVVKASEEGTIKSIKNDPRYGLTVVIEHTDGYTTSYSNLLTAEFVKVGEKVSKGQTIATIGTTATFEIADEEHLHFEILKDGTAVDPSMYLK